MADAAAQAVGCPACQAQPQRYCTVPTDRGRREVTWAHLSRITAAKEAQS